MNTEIEQNIINAFKVVQETYNSISKLHKHFQKYNDKDPYKLAVKDFLRWKSDKNCWGWAVRRFIFLFQKNEPEKQFANSLYPLYVLELDFYYDKPILRFAKFEYEDNKNWSIFSPASLWAFDQPLHEDIVGVIGEKKAPANGITEINISNNDKQKKYLGLKQIHYSERNLTELTSKNCDAMLNEEFGRL